MGAVQRFNEAKALVAKLRGFPVTVTVATVGPDPLKLEMRVPSYVDEQGRRDAANAVLDAYVDSCHADAVNEIQKAIQNGLDLK